MDKKINFDKYVLYEIDPLFFFDSNNDGFGDFEGMIEKLFYFKKMEIDGFLFPDIFNQEETILKNIDVTVFNKYGNLKKLKELISEIKKINKSIYIEINLKNDH